MASIKGLDLYNSNWERSGDNIDFHAIKAAGYDFVILKITEGVDFVDASVGKMAPLVKDAGLLLGYYHFATPGGSKSRSGYKKWWDAPDEARDLLDALKNVPKPDLRVALDFEWKTDHIEETLPNKADRTRWAVEFIEIVEAELGYKPMFYSYGYYMGKHLVPHETINACPLWLARYNDEPGFKEEWGWDRYEIWQYTSSGTVPGVVGDVDLNDAPHGLDRVLVPKGDCEVSLKDQFKEHVEAIREHCSHLDTVILGRCDELDKLIEKL